MFLILDPKMVVVDIEQCRVDILLRRSEEQGPEEGPTGKSMSKKDVLSLKYENALNL